MASVAALTAIKAAPKATVATIAAIKAAPKATVAALAAIEAAPKASDANPATTAYNPHPIDCCVVTNPTAAYAEMNRRIHSMETAISRIGSMYASAIAQIATTCDSNLGQFSREMTKQDENTRLRYQVEHLRGIIKLASKAESYGGGTTSDTETQRRHDEGSTAGTINQQD